MSRDIGKWLMDFKKACTEKDIDAVLELFTDEADYYETPFTEFQNKDELRDEWKTIQDQEDIDLEFEVFNSEEDRFTVIWSLNYEQEGKAYKSEGVYLIKLNSQNKCYQFTQYPVTQD